MNVPRTALVALALSCALSAAPPALGQGRTAVRIADRTDAGRFEGTWIYSNRDMRMALWLRDTESGPPEIKLRYQSTSSPEAFETDWDGRAEYYLSGQRALFEVALGEGDRDVVAGTWTWVVQFARSGREERGTFTMYRGLDGRRLVLRFDRFERRVTRGDEVREHEPVDHSMTFMKASKRIVLWDELPF